jgi:AcrR family transcriptional regulator
MVLREHRVSKNTAGQPRRGRPRDPQIERAVLRAVRERLAINGYARLTIGDVAADAGVSRPAVYRRWPTKQALVVAALDSAFQNRQSRLDTIDLDQLSPRMVVVEAVKRLYGRTNDGPGIRAIGKVLVEADQTPGLLDVLREHALQPRRELFLQTLRDLQARKTLRADLDLDIVAEMCLGAFFSSYLLAGQSEADGNDELVTRLVDALWPYLQTRPR